MEIGNRVRVLPEGFTSLTGGVRWGSKADLPPQHISLLNLLRAVFSHPYAHLRLLRF